MVSRELVRRRRAERWGAVTGRSVPATTPMFDSASPASRATRAIARLQIVEAFLPARPRLGRAGGALLEYPHSPGANKSIHLGTQGLPTGAASRVPNHIAGRVKNPSRPVSTSFHFENQF